MQSVTSQWFAFSSTALAPLNIGITCALPGIPKGCEAFAGGEERERRYHRNTNGMESGDPEGVVAGRRCEPSGFDILPRSSLPAVSLPLHRRLMAGTATGITPIAISSAHVALAQTYSPQRGREPEDSNLRLRAAKAPSCCVASDVCRVLSCQRAVAGARGAGQRSIGRGSKSTKIFACCEIFLARDCSRVFAN